MSDTELNECLQLASHPVSINQTYQDDDEGTLENVLEDTESDRPDKSARQHLLKESMVGLLEGLEEREAEILRLYYGLGQQATLDPGGDRPALRTHPGARPPDQVARPGAPAPPLAHPS